MKAIRYPWKVAPEANTPLAPGAYLVHIEEGGTYRSLTTRRKYTVDEIDAESDELTYRYTRGPGESVTRTGGLLDLAIVESVGDTPRALLQQPGGGR